MNVCQSLYRVWWSLFCTFPQFYLPVYFSPKFTKRNKYSVPHIPSNPQFHTAGPCWLCAPIFTPVIESARFYVINASAVHKTSVYISLICYFSHSHAFAPSLSVYFFIWSTSKLPSKIQTHSLLPLIWFKSFYSHSRIFFKLSCVCERFV